MNGTFFLVRHASHDLLGRVLAGRMEGVGLSATGRDEAGRVAERLAGEPVRAVFSSPLQRALETAEPIAAQHGLTPATDPAFTEIEFGDWTGLRFNSLDEDPDWSTWNTQRSLTRPPRGETMLEVQTRAVARILALSRERGDGAVVLVSHQDVIKAVLAHLLGLSLDCLHRFEIDPGSVSAVVVGAWGAKILFVNRTDPGKTAAVA